MPLHEVICERCGKRFPIEDWRFRRGNARFCSRECLQNRVTLVCLRCGQEFKFKRSALRGGTRGKFCSKACQYAAARGKPPRPPDPEKWVRCTCQVCGKEFSITLSRAMRDDGSGSYCSRACKDKSQQARRGPAHPRWVEPVTRICPVCGTPFPVKPGRVKEYCSRECWARAVGENTGPNSPRWIEREKRVCKQCSTEFDIERWRVARGGGTYCSFACLIEAQRGPGATNWQGGRSFEPYCFRFNKEFKQRVRLFFGNVCFVCGKTPDENGKNLHVHHVDGNPQTCCDDSPPAFVPLCNSCHMRVRYNRGVWRQHFHARIAEDHGGRCFLSKDEYLRRDEQTTLDTDP